ncbi:TetR/AcrR family transcriptional regulator [Lysinibacter sp. HNR]|uniref:TetR/AcrR family transcriptional regulator n=1 Tax=Lysinibacter sp. HNR TaxID=3031408 RepID=UPI0024360604|nr:TetR/AcrR family transcriptional regulator [Lysinibacter sp. HNR]WGD37326.1 helix-turn-helix domain containing protein [Lysinibacter sp. HNR]
MTQEPHPHSKVERHSPRGDARRRAILDSATRLFSENGFHVATIAEIAEDVGISQAGLLHHFPSKSSLLLAVLRERDERSPRAIELNATSGAQYLQTFCGMLRDHEKTPALMKLNALLSGESLSDEHPAQEWFRTSYVQRIESMRMALTKIINTTKLPPGTTIETVARWIVALADGMRYQWLLEDTSFSRADSIMQFLELLRPSFYDPQLDLQHEPGREETGL